MLIRGGLCGWKVSTVGDDIAWIKPGADGRLRAINPETASSAWRRNLVSVQSQRDGHAAGELHLHQCRAHAGRRCLVGGHDGQPPAQLTDWQGQPWTPIAAQGRASERRFTVPASQCPSIDPDWENPRACPFPPSSSAVPQHHHAAHRGELQLDRWRVPRGHHGVGDHRSCHRQGGRSAPRSVRDAAFLRLSHRRLFRSLALDRQRSRQSAAHLLRQLVPQGCRRAILWPATARTCAC